MNSCREGVVRDRNRARIETADPARHQPSTPQDSAPGTQPGDR
eukprot:gene26838-biopygen17427